VVPPPRPADDLPGHPWLTEIRTILRLSRGGVLVGLYGAHSGVVRPLVEALEDGSDPLVIAFSVTDLLDAPAGARVVLLDALRDPDGLNLVRPVVVERGLRVFVWLYPGELGQLRRRAPDFVDWMQRSVDIPVFLPDFVREEAQAGAWVSRPMAWDEAAAALEARGVADPRVEAGRRGLRSTNIRGEDLVPLGNLDNVLQAVLTAAVPPGGGVQPRWSLADLPAADREALARSAQATPPDRVPRAGEWLPSDEDPPPGYLPPVAAHDVVARSPVVVVGPPGAGKSALLDHLQRSIPAGPTLRAWTSQAPDATVDAVMAWITQAVADWRVDQAEPEELDPADPDEPPDELAEAAWWTHQGRLAGLPTLLLLDEVPAVDDPAALARRLRPFGPVVLAIQGRDTLRVLDDEEGWSDAFHRVALRDAPVVSARPPHGPHPPGIARMRALLDARRGDDPTLPEAAIGPLCVASGGRPRELIALRQACLAAGVADPRNDLHERLDRVLERARTRRTSDLTTADVEALRALLQREGARPPREDPLRAVVDHLELTGDVRRFVYADGETRWLPHPVLLPWLERRG
jgi:integrase